MVQVLRLYSENDRLKVGHWYRCSGSTARMTGSKWVIGTGAQAQGGSLLQVLRLYRLKVGFSVECLETQCSILLKVLCSSDISDVNLICLACFLVAPCRVRQ